MHQRISSDRPDLPYYNGEPVPLTTRGCLRVLAACALGFAALVWLPRHVAAPLGGWLAALAFVGLQLAGLVLAVGPAWRALFRRPRPRDLLLAVACVPLVMAFPALVAYLVVGSSNLSGNPVIEGMGAQSGWQAAQMFGMAAVQLLGEELVTILPLLVLLTLLHRAGLRRGPAIAIAWVVTALVFGALHLPTYHWHFGQALLVIGAARLVLTGIYLLTRNLWASTVAHIVNDWSMMALAIVLAGQAAS
jgi:membrane protease YdiL (CAAX protease family)